MGDLNADYDILRTGAGAVRLPVAAVRVAGPEAAAFLQGQLSQDIVAIEPGLAAESLLLSPQGKVEALLRVVRMADDEFMLEVDAGFEEAVAARLERFKLRTKADIGLVEGWSVVAVRGTAATAPPPGSDEHMVIAVDGPVLSGYDVCGIDVEIPRGAVECDPAAFEALRIEAGLPRMGSELTGATIPAEAGIVEQTVSFTKGCYTGQELVARIDSRGGNVARHLRGLVVDGSEAPPDGAAVVVDGQEVGVVTSVSFSPGFDRHVALAYVHRRIEPPADATVVGTGRDGDAARVCVLPMLP